MLVVVVLVGFGGSLRSAARTAKYAGFGSSSSSHMRGFVDRPKNESSQVLRSLMPQTVIPVQPAARHSDATWP